MLVSPDASLADYSKVFARLQALRLIAHETLPKHQSLLVYDLMLWVAHEQSHCRPTMMKSIFMSLPHSATGLRRHLRALIRDRWLVVSRDNSDRRVRHLKLTKKGIRALLQCAEHSSLVLDATRSGA